MKKIDKKTKLINRIEKEFNLPIEDLLYQLYIVDELTFDEIRIKLRLSNKAKAIQLVREAGIYSKKLSSLIRIL